VYGHDGPATGPLPVDADQNRDGTIIVRFTETGGRLVTTDAKAPRHFEIAGEDGGFVPAACQIDGDKVILSSPTGQPPGSIYQVRYAWQPFPEPAVNLTGTTGLPASPFQIPVSHPGRQ